MAGHGIMNNTASAILRDEVKIFYRSALHFVEVINVHVRRAFVSSSVGRFARNSVVLSSAACRYITANFTQRGQ